MAFENNIKTLYLQWKREKPIYTHLMKTIMINVNLLTIHYIIKGTKWSIILFAQKEKPICNKLNWIELN